MSRSRVHGRFNLLCENDTGGMLYDHLIERSVSQKSVSLNIAERRTLCAIYAEQDVVLDQCSLARRQIEIVGYFGSVSSS